MGILDSTIFLCGQNQVHTSSWRHYHVVVCSGSSWLCDFSPLKVVFHLARSKYIRIKDGKANIFDKKLASEDLNFNGFHRWKTLQRHSLHFLVGSNTPGHSLRCYGGHRNNTRR